MTDARRLRPRRTPPTAPAPAAAGTEHRSDDQHIRRWLILIVAGVVIAAGAPALWLATRPAASVGAPVAGPAQTSRAGVQAATPGPADTTVPATIPTIAAAVPPAGQQDGTLGGTQDAGSVPTRLTIPARGINAPVDPVGIDANGAMALPVDVHRVGWYRFSPAPGADEGSVVVSGHVDNAEQGKGAMFTLGSAEVGDRITLRTADGASHVYRVTGRQTIVKKRLPVEELFTRTGPPRLILITCGGPFIASLHSYQDNLVVAAEPI